MKILKKIYYKKYSKISYSLSGVDLIIDRMFSKVKKGIYIDLGCNHPIKHNNTYLLHKRGWKGINIDADKESIKEFNSLRKKDYNVNALITSKDGEQKDFYFYHNRSAINTVSKKLVNSRIKKPKITKKITGSSLNTIIDNSPFKNEKINLLSIDIENYEYEVLRDFDFDKYKIEVIVTEITNLNMPKLEIFNNSLENITSSQIYKLLTKKNFKLINWINSDLIFVNTDINLSFYFDNKT